MIGALGRVKVYAYCEAVDMRKGFEGLAALVREQMGRDPLPGALFLLANRRRNRAKILHFDGTEMCVLAKRLEKGRFVARWMFAARRDPSSSYFCRADTSSAASAWRRRS